MARCRLLVLALAATLLLAAALPTATAAATEDERILDRFAQWLRSQNGAADWPLVAGPTESRSAVDATVRLAVGGDGSSTADGFLSRWRMQAAKPLAAGDVALRMPLSAMLTPEAMRRDADFAAIVEAHPDVKGASATALFMLLAKGSDGPATATATSAAFWRPYVDLLPGDMDASPIGWSDADLEELRGTQIHTPLGEVRSELQLMYLNLFPRMSTKYAALFPPTAAWLTQSRFDAYHTAARSRHLAGPSPAIAAALAPLVEFFNVRAAPNAVLRWALNDSVVEVVANASIAAGETLLFREAPIGNDLLLPFYGFALLNNPGDAFRLGLGLQRDDRMYGNKKKFLEARGLSNGQLYAIGPEGVIPDELTYALRVFFIQMFDYDLATERLPLGQRVSIPNEVRAFETLIEALRSSYQRYPSSSQADKERLAAMVAAEGAEGQQQRASPLFKALVLRESERRILRRAARDALTRLEEAQALWDLREFEIPSVTSHEGGGTMAAFEDHVDAADQ